MPFDKWKKTVVTLALLTAITGSGMIGWQSGKRARRGIDGPTISQLVKDKQHADEELAHHEISESAVTEFLQDLRGHLPADAELDTLFKAQELLHAPSDEALVGGGLASLECCKEETRTLSNLFRRGTEDNDPQVRVVGAWLRMRCFDRYIWAGGLDLRNKKHSPTDTGIPIR